MPFNSIHSISKASVNLLAGMKRKFKYSIFKMYSNFYFAYFIQVFVPNSYRSTESGHPFGYLKASTNLQSVNLFVMPYNYPALLPLLDELFRIHRLRPSAEWRGQFASYLRTMPPYYAAVS